MTIAFYLAKSVKCNYKNIYFNYKPLTATSLTAVWTSPETSLVILHRYIPVLDKSTGSIIN